MSRTQVQTPVSPPNTRPYLFLFPAIAGFIAVVISPVNYTIVALIQPGYNLFNQTISELGSVGAPFGNYVSICFFLSGIFEAIWGLGFSFSLQRGSRVIWGSVLVIISGLFNSTGSGLFRLGNTTQDLLHDVVSIIGEGAMILAPYVLLSPMQKTPGWEKMRKITIVVGILFIIMLVLSPIAEFIQFGQGFVQRIGDFAYYFWIFCGSIQFILTWHSEKSRSENQPRLK